MPRSKKIVEEIGTPSEGEHVLEVGKTRVELEAEVEALKKALLEKTEAVEVAPVEEIKAPEPNGVPIPSDFLETVKTGLNDKFKVEIEYSSNTPNFGFSILVPKEYSNAAKPHWDMYKEDRRTRMISNAEGLQGVKQWVERVYNNFDNETKARIAMDRV